MKIILAILLPPVACLVAGKPKRALINIPLTFLFWIPGVIHAVRTVRAAQAEKDSVRKEVEYDFPSTSQRQKNDKMRGKALQYYKSTEQNRKAGLVKEAEEKYWESIERWNRSKGKPAPAPFRELAKLYYHTGFTGKAIEVIDSYLNPSHWPQDLLQEVCVAQIVVDTGSMALF